LWFRGLAGWKYEPPGRTLPLAGSSVSRKHRFVVAFGEWVVEPWFDDRLEGLWRVPSGIDPHAGFPQIPRWRLAAPSVLERALR